MRITLSQYAGFCDGVKRAFDIVMNEEVAGLKGPVFVLGSLVHNDKVNKKIEEKGIGKIDRETFLAAKPGDIGTIIVTAHGVGPDIFEKAREKDIEVIDTTCPKVIKVQRLAKLFSGKGYKIILIGDKGHKEVKGIDEWGGGNSYIISEKKDIDGLDFSPEEKIMILSQTTQDEDFCEEIGRMIRERYAEAEMIKTTCHTTHSRQEEVKELAQNNDAVLVIGSAASANSKRLWEIASRINPRSYFVEKASEIDTNWFNGVENIGVTAGASTPEWTIREVLEVLGKLVVLTENILVKS